jgi:hypothetical protein
VKDIFIAGVDGLKEFPEIIESIHPRTQVQLCMAAQASRQRSAVGLSRSDCGTALGGAGGLMESNPHYIDNTSTQQSTSWKRYLRTLFKRRL